MNNKLSLIVNFTGVDKMSGALKNIVGLGKKGSQSLRSLTGEARKLQGEIKRYDRLLAQTSGNTTALWDGQKRKMQELEQVQSRIARQQRLMGIEADRQAMKNRADSLASAGQQNIVGGAAMAAPLIYATKAAADFSSGMVDIQQKAQLSNQATDQLSSRIIAASKAARQMPEDMRAGIDALLAKGMGLDAATAAIGPIGKLSTAYKVEIPDAANATYAALSNLKIAAGDTSKILDAMAAAGNDGGFEIADMARNFPSLTAQLQALGDKGIPAVADLSAALQVAMHTAGNADEAGNNIKNLLAKINAPGTIRAFEKNFGVNLPAAMKKMTDQGYSSLEAITLITQKATGGDTKKLGFAFEDMQARQGIMAMIQNLQEYRKIRDHALHSKGTIAGDLNSRVTRDATVQWKALLSTSSRLAIVLGTTLLPVATQVLGSIEHGADMVANWAKANPALAATLMKGAATLISFKIGLGVAQYALGTILGPLANVIAIARKAAPVLGLLRTAVLFLGKGFLRAGIMMMANPIVLLITAVVVAVGAAAYLIYTHWDKIKAAFWGGVSWVKKTLGGLPDWMKSLGSMMMQGLLMAINPLALGAKLIHMAKNGITAFKAYLGIKSPSRVMMAMGGHVAAGLERGIDENRHGPSRAMRRMAAGVMAAGAVSMSPMAAARPVQADATGSGGNTYHLHIHQLPGESAEEFADRVIAAIEKKEERKRRRGFGDD